MIDRFLCWNKLKIKVAWVSCAWQNLQPTSQYPRNSVFITLSGTGFSFTRQYKHPFTSDDNKEQLWKMPYVKKTTKEKLKRLQDLKIKRWSSKNDHNYVNISDCDWVDVGAEEEVRTTGSWQEGRRVVELDLLADWLKSCQRCSKPLRLDYSWGKEIWLGSYFIS